MKLTHVSDVLEAMMERDIDDIVIEGDVPALPKKMDKAAKLALLGTLVVLSGALIYEGGKLILRVMVNHEEKNKPG